MIPFISLFEIIDVLIPDPNIFLKIGTSVTDAAAVNPTVIKTLLANGFSISFIKGNPIFTNGPESLPKNPPDCPTLYNYVFDSFVLTEELFAKALRSLETCVLANNHYNHQQHLMKVLKLLFSSRF